jgi:hypothetical protein
MAIALVTVAILVAVYAVTIWIDAPSSQGNGDRSFDA